MGCSPAKAQRKRSVTIRSSLLPTFLHFLLSGFHPSCLGGERRVLSDVEERKPKGGCDLPAKMGRKKKKKKLPRCECLLQKTRSLSFPPLYPGLQIATTQFSIREAPAKYKVWCASCVLLFQMFERFAVLEFRPQATVCVLRPAPCFISSFCTDIICPRWARCQKVVEV